jgi:hypothetical protein
MNLLQQGGSSSIRQGIRKLACDIKRTLALEGITSAGAITGSRF